MECDSAILSRADRQFDWGTKKAPMRLPGAWINPCQAVIYEMHLQDLTKSPTSGVTSLYVEPIWGLAKKEPSIAMVMQLPLIISVS